MEKRCWRNLRAGWTTDVQQAWKSTSVYVKSSNPYETTKKTCNPCSAQQTRRRANVVLESCRHWRQSLQCTYVTEFRKTLTTLAEYPQMRSTCRLFYGVSTQLMSFFSFAASKTTFSCIRVASDVAESMMHRFHDWPPSDHKTHLFRAQSHVVHAKFQFGFCTLQSARQQTLSLLPEKLSAPVHWQALPRQSRAPWWTRHPLHVL